MAEGIGARPFVVHGHFYQPPREDPRTGWIEIQPGAAPWHDWNELVHAESYKPNAFARIPGHDGDIIVNNFERISFNIGPTLLEWMEKADPETYGRIIDADRESRERLGHGNAIAQAYNHSILPLEPPRDARTQIRWGVADFRHRFGRDPIGMWLPETAADEQTLALLIEEGIGFTILAPGQADGDIDTRIGYHFAHPDGSGRVLAVFFYDGEIARAIAFENAGSSAHRFLDLFAAKAGDDCTLVHAATDGETYGHHHRFSDLGLAFALFIEAEKAALTPVNYPSFLERCPPTEVRRLKAGGTSWSCAHGIERWRSDCGCSTGGEPGWNQKWREPLREGLEILREAGAEAFETLGREMVHDPWAVRDDHIRVILGETSFEAFAAEHSSGPIDEPATERLRTILEMQRLAMAMFTSCGWFFNDVSGIETVQVLRYAARVIELIESLGWPSPREAVLERLSEAQSNDPGVGTAADLIPLG